MAIRGALFNKNLKCVNTVNQLLSSTKMASACHSFALSSTLVTLSLELLHKSWSELLFCNDLARPIAFSTCFNIFWVLATTAAAMWTDDLAVVRNIKGFAYIQLFKS